MRLHRLDYASSSGFLLYSSSSVITPICLVHLSRELNFNLAQGGAVEAIRCLLMVLILLVSGFVAARWGKVRMLGLSAFVLSTGLVLYAFAPSYATVLIIMGAIGLSSGVLEALINPLIHELHPNDSGRYLNFVNGFWSAGIVGTVLIAGELLTRGVSWRVIVCAIGGLGSISGILFLVHASHGSRLHKPVSFADTFGHAQKILRRRGFWVFAAAMFFGAGAEGAYTFWTATFVQLQHGGTPRAAGLGTACFAGGMLLGRFAFGRFVPQHRLRTLLLLSSAAGFLVSWTIPMADSLTTLFMLLFVAGLTVACFWPSIQGYATDRISHDATMVFILLSCMGIPGFGLTTWVLGVVAEKTTLRTSFLIIPFVFLALVVTLVVESGVFSRHSGAQA
ncbi:MAG: MFS transporter [Candidatus Pacebacteria bacterium]|nr:MFS transporter [Candidatus Paceibacterota bacterium]